MATASTATTQTTTTKAASTDAAGGSVMLAKDGHKLYMKVWSHETLTTPPTAIVVLVHGLGEHVNRYNHVAEAFVQQGIKVAGFDQRGFGRSPGTRGDSGDKNATMNDIETLVQLQFERGVPLFLYGHSMGGLNVLKFIVQRSPQNEQEYPIAGVIASAPAIAPGTPPDVISEMAGRALSSIPFLKELTVNANLQLATLCRDPEVVKAYTADPLVHPYISLRTAASVLGGGDYMRSTGHALFKKPLLMAFGTGDKLTNFAEGKAFFDKVGSTDKTFTSYEGYYHELHNEPEKDAVIKSYAEWILQRSNKARM